MAHEAPLQRTIIRELQEMLGEERFLFAPVGNTALTIYRDEYEALMEQANLNFDVVNLKTMDSYGEYRKVDRKSLERFSRKVKAGRIEKCVVFDDLCFRGTTLAGVVIEVAKRAGDIRLGEIILAVTMDVAVPGDPIAGDKGGGVANVVHKRVYKNFIGIKDYIRRRTPDLYDRMDRQRLLQVISDRAPRYYNYLGGDWKMVGSK